MIKLLRTRRRVRREPAGAVLAKKKPRIMPGLEALERERKNQYFATTGALSQWNL